MIYLVCGVPGSGKTWVLSHFKDIVHYDRHFNTPRAQYAQLLVDTAKKHDIVADCPLGVSEIVNHVRQCKADIRLYFIIEHPTTVSYRYYKREGKPIPKQHLSRISTMLLRAHQYNAFRGTSNEVYEQLIRDGAVIRV